MYAVGDAQHVKRVAFRLVAVDVGEAVFADVLVLRLDGVASAEDPGSSRCPCLWTHPPCRQEA